mgnify:FL=1
MIVLYLILLAVIQAVTEFLPVSSLGHLAVVEHFLGMEQDAGLLIESMLHLGTAAAIIFLYRNELKRLLLEAVGMLMDTIGNLNLYIHNRRTGNRLKYARIVTGSYRKFAALLLVSMIPTALLGISSRRLAVVAGASPICQGIGFLISGIILLVTDLNNSGGEKGPREASWDSAMWIGICQGLSVFPGISRLGLTVCAALLCGYSRKFALLFSIFMSLPAVIGAFFTEIGYFGAASMTVGMIFASIFAMLLAGVAGCLVIRFMVQLVQKTKFRYFAVYSFAIGVIVLLCNYAF